MQRSFPPDMCACSSCGKKEGGKGRRRRRRTSRETKNNTLARRVARVSFVAAPPTDAITTCKLLLDSIRLDIEDEQRMREERGGGRGAMESAPGSRPITPLLLCIIYNAHVHHARVYIPGYIRVSPDYRRPAPRLLYNTTCFSS